MSLVKVVLGGYVFPEGPEYRRRAGSELTVSFQLNTHKQVRKIKNKNFLVVPIIS